MKILMGMLEGGVEDWKSYGSFPVGRWIVRCCELGPFF